MSVGPACRNRRRKSIFAASVIRRTSCSVLWSVAASLGLSHLEHVRVNESALFDLPAANRLSAAAMERIETMAREFKSQLASIHATTGMTMSGGETIHVTGVTDATRVAGS